MDNHNITYFTIDNTELIKELRKQGQDVCRQKISKKWIYASLDDFQFGFVHATRKSQVGRMKRGKSNLHIASFVLCKKMTNNNLDLKLVCSRPNNREGVLLIHNVEQYAKEEGFKILSLFSLPDYKLVEWYKKQGFVIKSESRDPKNYELKTYYMEKEI